MARIPMRSGFTLCPEGKHIFRIYDATYDEAWGRLEVKMVNAQGITHTERFGLIDPNTNEANEGAMNAFSYFAKTALQDFSLEEIDHTDLIGHYICAEVHHTTSPSKRDPTKTVTFANLGDKSPADGFDTTPVPAAMTLGPSGQQAPAAPASAPAPAPAASTGSLDLKSLLG